MESQNRNAIMGDDKSTEDQNSVTTVQASRTVLMDEAFLEALLRIVPLSERNPASPSIYAVENRPRIAPLTELDDRENLGEFLMR